MTNIEILKKFTAKRKFYKKLIEAVNYKDKEFLERFVIQAKLHNRMERERKILKEMLK
jgi:ribosomal protein S18